MKKLQFPPQAAPFLFATILSGLMSLLVSGIATFRNAGFGPQFVHAWLGAWLTAWVIALPVVLVIAPFTRKLVARMVRPA